MMRQIVLDTETTGLDASKGHRLIEIGCVELIERRLTGRTFHQYLNPERDIDEGATRVHGLTFEMLQDKPRFADIAELFIDFVGGAQLIIHNAAFDMGFLDHELGRLKKPSLSSQCQVMDTLLLARSRHPGQKNDLDSLCRRYSVDNSHRDRHGALLDAEILARVYLAMTGGQVSMLLDAEGEAADSRTSENASTPRHALPRPDRSPLRVIRASQEELEAHRAYLEGLDKESRGPCLWRVWETP